MSASTTVSSSASSSIAARTAECRRHMHALHKSGVTLSSEWRLQQLNAFEKMLDENQDAIRLALYQDLQKDWTMATVAEICTLQDELKLIKSLLPSWMQDTPLPSPGICFPSTTWLQKRPLAAPGLLVLGPSNYPFSLTLHPAIASLANGNPTLLKPSEHCPAVSQLLSHLVPRYFPNHALQVMTGGIPETSHLIHQRWGCIFFTGSTTVGKIVATAAATTLTPTLLECGGKCPCLVDETVTVSELQQAAHRIVWAKSLNAGQTCASVDYIVVHESVASKLVPCLVKAWHDQFGSNPKESEFGRIVTAKPHAQRLLELIQQVEDFASATTAVEIVLGGSKDCDVASRYIAPTIVLLKNADENLDNYMALLRILSEEIFGPVLPVLVVGSRAASIALTKYISGMAPLCLYVFTQSLQVFDEISNAIMSGSVVRNDCLVHLASSRLPFGGLGKSGYGRYHGKYSLQAFCHLRPVMYRPCAPGADFNRLRYHPFGSSSSTDGSSGIKGKLVAHGLMKLPYLPVVPQWLKRMCTLGAVAAVAIRTVPMVSDLWTVLLLQVAVELERIVIWLRL